VKLPAGVLSALGAPPAGWTFSTKTKKLSRPGSPWSSSGLVGYVAIAVALLASGERARLAAAALAVTGFGFGAYLTYLELFVIDAICQWCVASAALLTLLCVVTVSCLLVYDDPIA
jgi:uncharacterized membrane protein